MSESSNIVTNLNVYANDLRIGNRIHYGRGRTITESDIVSFAAFSGDWSSLHTDIEWCAANSLFSDRIAHGFLTLSIATGLEFTAFGSNQDKVLALYGMDHVRFLHPVFVGDTIHVEGKIIEIHNKYPTRSIVVIRQKIINQNDETIAVLDKCLLMKNRSYDE